MIRNFGEKGVRAHFFQDGCWQAGRAWLVDHRGVAGRCRDYTNGARMPLETHGFWPLDQVRGLEKHLAPVQQDLAL